MQVKEKRIRVKTESKVYGFLRCNEGAVPKLKVIAARLGYPSMVSFLDDLAGVSVKDFKVLLK